MNRQKHCVKHMAIRFIHGALKMKKSESLLRKILPSSLDMALRLTPRNSARAVLVKGIWIYPPSSGARLCKYITIRSLKEFWLVILNFRLEKIFRFARILMRFVEKVCWCEHLQPESDKIRFKSRNIIVQSVSALNCIGLYVVWTQASASPNEYPGEKWFILILL